MIISPNKIIGSLTYRTRESLRKNNSFLKGLDKYQFRAELFNNELFNLWHIPGTFNEISNVFLELGKSEKFNLKYPAIFNINPIRQIKNGQTNTSYFNLILVAPVLSEWLTQQREEEVFTPLLRPIYDEFIKQVIKSGYFIDFGIPQHEYYEVFTTGNTGGVLLEKYGDHVDAIELHNLTLKLKNICGRDYDKIEYENNLVTEIFK